MAPEQQTHLHSCDRKLLH